MISLGGEHYRFKNLKFELKNTYLSNFRARHCQGDIQTLRTHTGDFMELLNLMTHQHPVFAIRTSIKSLPLLYELVCQWDKIYEYPPVHTASDGKGLILLIKKDKRLFNTRNTNFVVAKHYCNIVLNFNTIDHYTQQFLLSKLRLRIEQHDSIPEIYKKTAEYLLEVGGDLLDVPYIVAHLSRTPD